MAGPVYLYRDRRWDRIRFSHTPFSEGYLLTLPNGERVPASRAIGEPGEPYDEWQVAFLKMLGYPQRDDGTWGLQRPEFRDADPGELAARAAQERNRAREGS